MSLTAGTRLGPYEITSAIGAGGMGEVYKARDTRLDRTVAIKVLPEHLSENAELRQRFEQEARAVSSLNHPHICTLYDVGRENGVDFLVMEYLEGETLAERLDKGALPLDQALRYGMQIADALDQAHRHGIVHRDLKPGNVILTKSGAKLLDFGLAKFHRARATPDLSAVTAERPLTEKGTILGTFQYMAPEQLEGRDADARTDIFAFGALLYEMITGKKAFEGKSQASLIHAIMGVDPSPIQDLQPMSPATLGRVVETCLKKDPDDRWQSARDMTRELRWIAEARAPETAATTRVGHLGLRFALVGLVAGVLLMLAAAILFWPQRPNQPLTRFRIRPDSMSVSFFHSLELSPNGRTIVYVSEHDGAARLYRRSLGGLERTEIHAADDIRSPFFSPDGEWVGFVAGDDGSELRKVPLAGGPAITICKVSGFFTGASWGEDDTVVFASETHGIQEVSASGGEPTLIEAAESGVLLLFPEVLPEGKAVIYTVDGKIAILPRETGERRILFEGTSARYAASGHLVYQRERSLWAVPFDADRLEILGPHALVLENTELSLSKAHFSLAPDGTLAYIPANQSAADPLVWVDREGKSEIVNKTMGSFAGWSRISPDETRLALEGFGQKGTDIWIYDIGRGTKTRLTMDGRGIDPVWSPEGDAVVFSILGGDASIYKARADGGGEPEPVVTSDGARLRVTSWSTDGKLLTLDALHTGDVWVASLDGGEPVPFVDTPFDEWGARFSPDGGFIAYVSDESGRDEIYVQPYPGPGDRWTVSTSGGREPVWSKDGGELFYRHRSQLMVVAIRTEPEFRAGAPQILFDGPFARSASGTYYDVSRDAQRFVMLSRDNVGGGDRHIVVVLNWLDELTRLAPPGE